MPLARDLHPEFGYMGNAPAVLRKVGFAIAFIGVGSIAAISNLSTFVSAPEDPMQAMALAPEQALNSTAPSVVHSPAPAISAEDDAGAKRFCGGAITVDCIPTKMHRPHSVPAANERPAIATVAIGHPEKPAVLPAQPAATVPAEPSSADTSATPTEAPVDAAAVETPAPVEPPPAPAPVPAKKSRTRSNYAHRERDYGRPSYSSSYSYHSTQSGYARVW